METTKIGIRGFRENLAGYLESDQPLAITRHGETLGFYIPAQKRNWTAELEAMRAAAKDSGRDPRDPLSCNRHLPVSTKDGKIPPTPSESTPTTKMPGILTNPGHFVFCIEQATYRSG